MSKKLPIVAIVGRANVGKSSLFNAVLERREAIVAREAGTTRDSVLAKASVPLRRDGERREERGERRGAPRQPKDYGLRTKDSLTKNRTDFWLVDTAGMKDPEDDFEFTIQEQITQAADSADIILVAIDAATIITEEDRRVAKLALKSKKPVILLVNKIDKKPKADPKDFQKLGVKPILLTSATQNRGIDDLLRTLAKNLPKATLDEADDRLRVALLGRPNVGKSALFNTLAKKQQAIVADRAGTTRDVNRSVVRFDGQEIELMDTAGIRKSGKIGQGIERFSVIRSIAAIEQADVCLLLMDANELNVALDQKIAGMVKEAGKGLILVVSKWDSLDKDAYTRDHMAPRIAANFDFVPWAPLIFTSAVSGQNVAKIFDLVLDIEKSRLRRIRTADLNRWLQKTTAKHPPAGLKNRSPKLNYIIQEDDNPTNFKIYGSHTKFLHWSYKRYLDRKIREAYGFEGTPVKFWFFDKRIKEK